MRKGMGLKPQNTGKKARRGSYVKRTKKNKNR